MSGRKTHRESLMFNDLQRLAHRDSRCAEKPREFLLLQWRTAPDRSRQDLIRQLICDIICCSLVHLYLHTAAVLLYPLNRSSFSTTLPFLI